MINHQDAVGAYWRASISQSVREHDRLSRDYEVADPVRRPILKVRMEAALADAYAKREIYNQVMARA